MATKVAAAGVFKKVWIDVATGCETAFWLCALPIALLTAATLVGWVAFPALTYVCAAAVVAATQTSGVTVEELVAGVGGVLIESSKIPEYGLGFKNSI